MHTASSAQDFANTKFDYIIVGAGNAGLPLAVRLAQNPDVKVGILEAGPVPSDDPLITQPRFIGFAPNNPAFDWCFKSVPQKHAGGREIQVPRGKGVSGTTSVNYTVLDRASKAEYDAWGQLSDGEGAWNWDSLLPYFKKLEDASSALPSDDPFPSMSLNDSAVTRAGVTPQDAVGTTGPVKASYNTLYPGIIPVVLKAFNSLGVPTNANAYGGVTDGIKNLRRTVDANTGKRITAASAYAGLADKCANLQILTGAMVTQLAFNKEANAAGDYTVSGVEFTAGGKQYTVAAGKEVILSCGTVQTPQLLELSGIGKASLLESLGIPCLVDLPGVGENLHDHNFAPIQYLLKPGSVTTFDRLRNEPEFLQEETKKYEETGKGWLAASDTTAIYTPLHRVAGDEGAATILDALKQSIAKSKELGELTPLQEKQYEIQVDWLSKNPVPNLETIIFSKALAMPEQGRSYFAMLVGNQHPFSRGSIHITSKDPLKAPEIDPNYLSHEIDVELLAAGFRFLEKAAASSHLSEVIEKPTIPPVPLAEKAHLEGFIRQAASSGGHVMGTAPLASRKLGGVVDNKLKVYGTSNLRVADGSIIPLPLAAHIQATIYAIGEKAADLILNA